MRRVVIFGGYGAVGREAAAVLSPSYEVVVAGRNPPATVPGATTVRVDLRGSVDHALDGAYAVLMRSADGGRAVPPVSSRPRSSTDCPHCRPACGTWTRSSTRSVS